MLNDVNFNDASEDLKVSIKRWLKIADKNQQENEKFLAVLAIDILVSELDIYYSESNDFQFSSQGVDDFFNKLN